MARLEDLKSGATVRGVVPGEGVTVLAVQWHGTDAVELTYRDSSGRPGNVLLYRDREQDLEVAAETTSWTFDGDAALFRLVSEAYRIRLAYLFDPLLAVHTSLVEPLPHQITAVYERMLSRQPLRFLLADDPGAGKTIMASLLIKELLIRGDVQRCLVVCPGMLVEQWQDELWEKFHLPFEMLTNDALEAARTGNWFREHPLAIARLDKLARDEDVQAKLRSTDWDLVVVDEAHKMSASYFGSEIRYTKRYHLGELLGSVTRHMLLLTATPHSGIDENFQLFMALLDRDRFEGKPRDGTHVTVDPSDIMRRMVKEQLVKFDGTPLFPERRAYTVAYQLSDQEAQLYTRVTDYVRQEFNRADALEEGQRGTIGFALTGLQRRLASSPEAIYQSLNNRIDRLERRLAEERQGGRMPDAPRLTEEDLEDLEDAPEDEFTEAEEEVVDEATASRTIAELEAEIATLRQLAELANAVRRSDRDRKWEELRELLLENTEMFDANRTRRKIVIFTEHRATLGYLDRKIGALLGSETVVTIHGGLHRDDRRESQGKFTQDKGVSVLVATDAAGEGINLQRAHLMVNYDLPWNPNRLEQRFGRIHRIGQTEVCHLWNLVADQTREGDVFARLLRKLEVERAALSGAVFDVLGKVFQGTQLRQLLIEAVRYGDRPDVRARLTQQVEAALDTEHLRELIEERALAHETMDASRVEAIREQMERAEARRLQPHFIAEFFLEAFRFLGGTDRAREAGRWEIAHVPAAIRNRGRDLGGRGTILNRYERITFEKTRINVPGLPAAEFVCPGHPLLDAVTDLMLERHKHLLRRGAVLLDENDSGDEPRALYYLEHTIDDARQTPAGLPRSASRQLQFVEIHRTSPPRPAGYAPYLDYRPLFPGEWESVGPALEQGWLRDDLAARASTFAIEQIVPQHLAEVKLRREGHVMKTLAAVRDRLTREIAYWDRRAEELRAQEEAGRQPKMNWLRARERADELQRRLERRAKELEEERRLQPRPPVIVGGALVVPKGLLARLSGEGLDEHTGDQALRDQVEAIAMSAVMKAERALGFEPRDVSAAKCGWDIESKDAAGRLRFIEVKGRGADKRTVTITKNEILKSLNNADRFILALVRVDGERTDLRYLRRPTSQAPEFAVTSVNYDLKALWAQAEEPR